VQRQHGQRAVVVGGAGQHHPLRRDAHELGRLEIGNDDDLLADEVAGRVVLRDAGDDRPLLAAEGDGELEQLLRLRHRLGGDHLGDAQLHLREVVDGDRAAVRRCPAFAASLAGAHGCVASTYRLTAPMNSQISASARWKAKSPIARSMPCRVWSAFARSSSSPAPGAKAGAVAGAALAISVVARETRLPRSLARPALRRPTTASSEKSESRPNVISRRTK